MLMKDLVLIAHLEKCIGCRICELVCSSREDSGYNLTRSMIKILKNDEFNVYIPTLSPRCTLCMRCVNFCPTKALEFVEPEKAALIRKDVKLPVIPAPLIRL